MKPAFPPEAIEAVSEFTYRVSHDLGAPLRRMHAFSEILLTEHASQLDPQAKEFLTIVAKESARAKAMMEGLLEYSRLNTLAKTVTTEVDTNRVFEHCTVILNDEITQTKAAIHAETLPMIQADAEQFMQLLLYLLKNALTFTQSNTIPSILLEATEKAGQWHFTLRDNGIGIEPAYREKIFGLFNHLNSQDAYPDSIGIGLTLARKIVERHGGAIWVEGNEPAAGITVHFTFPAQQA